MSRLSWTEIVRFLGAGLGNTLLTLAIYEALVGFTGEEAAYAIAWAIGLGLVMLIYPRFVYRAKTSLRNGGAMGAIYVVVFFIGLGLTAWFRRLGLDKHLVIFAVLFFTLPLNYVGGKLVVGRNPTST